ncbi:MAG: phosphoribosyltransferase regulatory subunit, partial [Pseudomonadota bacterium]
MPLISLPPFSADLTALLQQRGTLHVDTPVIQPAGPFLDMAGEDLRRRIFLTESETGTSLCLRPEFTIPVCLRHIETATDTPQRYSYLGQVFRQRREGPNEFYQAGIEDLGDTDVAAADARIISDALASLAFTLPGRSLSLTLGDQSLFEAVVNALGLPAGWQKRLIHAFGNPDQLDALLQRLAHPPAPPVLDMKIASLLAAGDDAALVAYFDERMQATGYSANASRTPFEIVRRLKEKLALANTRLDAVTLAVLRAFLSLSVPLAEAPSALAGFANTAGIELDQALAQFDARVAALQAEGNDLSSMTYRAAFGRPLDYYTGLVFEITASGKTDVLAGGGEG